MNFKNQITKYNSKNQSFTTAKLLGGTLICVIPIDGKIIIVSDKRSINQNTGEIIRNDIEKTIQINPNSVISIIGTISIDYGPGAPFPAYDVVTEVKKIFQNKKNNLDHNDSTSVKLEIQQSLQRYLSNFSSQYWPKFENKPLFQIILFENNQFLQMTIFEVYCNTTNGIIVSYKGVDIKSSYLMAIGNTAVLNNSKNIHELNNLISNETFIKITNPNYQGFISEQEAITIAKLTIRQSAQYWNQVQGNLNDISTNLDVIVISCTEGITFKQKNTEN
ncbi:hypothetical protein [Chryseobacterium arthrosphaerae]|uniref:hypothetical protein n=1 Tax=Chryseobacterium arthrosphaerae TaxID=651561 RepID=UPI0031D4DF1A